MLLNVKNVKNIESGKTESLLETEQFIANKNETTRKIPIRGHLDLCATNKFHRFQIFILYLCPDKITDQNENQDGTNYNKAHSPKTIYTHTNIHIYGTSLIFL